MYIEPMYRGPSRDPCIGTIYPIFLGFGGIQAIILSYSPSLTVRIHFRFPFLVALLNEDEFGLVDIASSHQCKAPNSLILYYKPMTKSAFFKNVWSPAYFLMEHLLIGLLRPAGWMEHWSYSRTRLQHECISDILLHLS